MKAKTLGILLLAIAILAFEGNRQNLLYLFRICQDISLISPAWSAETNVNLYSQNNTKGNNMNNSINAKELCDAFISDPAKAEKEYGKKTMKITGFAVYVGPDVYALPSVELSEKKGGTSRTLCVLPFSDYLKLRHVSKDDQVVMEGEVRALYDKEKTVIVKECKIISVNGKAI